MSLISYWVLNRKPPRTVAVSHWVPFGFAGQLFACQLNEADWSTVMINRDVHRHARLAWERHWAPTCRTCAARHLAAAYLGEDNSK